MEFDDYKKPNILVYIYSSITWTVCYWHQETRLCDKGCDKLPNGMEYQIESMKTQL